MKKFSFVFLLLIIAYCKAYATYNVDAIIKNVHKDCNIKILGYGIGEIIIDEQQLNASGVYHFTFPDNALEGIYSIRIENCGQADRMVNEFDFVVDFKERLFKFSYDTTADVLPEVLVSEINTNWYSFIKVKTFRLNVIKYLETEKKNPLGTFSMSNKELLQEKAELEEIKRSFLQQNFNKWSTLAEEYDYSFYPNAALNAANYWDTFDTSDATLINTPMYQKLIQNYLVAYYSNADVGEYKIAFDKISTVFSKNSTTKNWIISYIMLALKTIDNPELVSFFSSNAGSKFK